MNLRNALALGIALTIPYLLLTSHYLSAPPPPPVDLAPYYATINSARALLAEHGAPVQPAQAPPAQPVVAPASSGTKDLVIGLAKRSTPKIWPSSRRRCDRPPPTATSSFLWIGRP